MREREERRERKGCAKATSLSQITVRVCMCVRFIIGPTVPIGGETTSAGIIIPAYYPDQIHVTASRL